MSAPRIRLSPRLAIVPQSLSQIGFIGEKINSLLERIAGTIAPVANRPLVTLQAARNGHDIFVLRVDLKSLQQQTDDLLLIVWLIINRNGQLQPESRIIKFFRIAA